MMVKVILAVTALVAVGYSAAPLFASQSIGGTCCADDGHCSDDEYCEFRVGNDCATGRTGYCVPIPR